jgi:hypothetical protein
MDLNAHILSAQWEILLPEEWRRDGGHLWRRLWPVILWKIINNMASCWYRYADDTFVVWPHRVDDLREFQHLNNIHIIKFTMGTETNVSLPFMDFLVTERTDGSPGSSVYRKRTHKKLYLYAHSGHHHRNRQCWLHWLTMHRNLDDEIRYLREIFRQNGYSAVAFNRTIYQTRERATEKTVSTVYIIQDQQVGWKI